MGKKRVTRGPKPAQPNVVVTKAKAPKAEKPTAKDEPPAKGKKKEG